MVRISLLAFVILVVQKLPAQPYVFYKRGKITVETLSSSGKTTESFPAAEKEKHSVEIRFPGNDSWNFSVNLRQFVDDSVESKSADTILFLSDIEGEFAYFRQMLLSHKVIDEKYNWVFGKNELVICGDLFDRGLGVTEQLWLLYKLEADASEKGGSVHVLLGNHEIMNLSGDLRYVQPIYFEQAKQLDKDYVQLFDEKTELGQWLRSKNIVEKIGRFLCLHGGISKEILNKKMSLAAINDLVRPWYAKWKADQPGFLEDFFNTNSPFWFRGYFDDPSGIEKLVNATLQRYDVDKIIVGHTIATMVAPFFGGKVWDINTNWHAGNAQGLLVEGEHYYRVNEKGLRTLVN